MTRWTLVGIALAVSALVTSPIISGSGFTIAFAQDNSTTVKTALADTTSPAELDKNTLRQRLRALRKAIQNGTLSGDELRQARANTKAYREELKRRKQPDDGSKKTETGGAGPEQQSPAKLPANENSSTQSSNQPATQTVHRTAEGRTGFMSACMGNGRVKAQCSCLHDELEKSGLHQVVEWLAKQDIHNLRIHPDREVPSGMWLELKVA